MGGSAVVRWQFAPGGVGAQDAFLSPPRSYRPIGHVSERSQGQKARVHALGPEAYEDGGPRHITPLSHLPAGAPSQAGITRFVDQALRAWFILDLEVGWHLENRIRIGDFVKLTGSTLKTINYYHKDGR